MAAFACVPRTLPIAGNPTAVAARDINGDGLVDLAVSTWTTSGGAVTAFLSQADGGFIALGPFATDPDPLAVAVVDLGQPGTMSLVTANVEFDDISVVLDPLLGTGLNTYSIQVNDAAWLAYADFNGDGVEDLVVGGDYAGPPYVNLGVFEGYAASSGFQTQLRIADAGAVGGVGTGDFNGDGRADVAVAFDGEVQIYLGAGDGGFTLGSLITSGTRPSALVVADLNSDGLTDIAVLSAVDGVVDEHLNLGGGLFATTTLPFGPGTVADALTFGHLAPGENDLVVGDATGSLLIFGTYDGGYSGARSVVGSGLGGAVAIADFTGDGIPDLATINFDAGAITLEVGPCSSADFVNTCQSSADPNLLADFEDGTANLLARGGRNGFVVVNSDGTCHNLAPPNNAPATPLPGGPNGSCFAGNVSGHDCRSYGAGLAMYLGVAPDAGCAPYDVSGYRGFSFWARAGDSSPNPYIQLYFENADTLPQFGNCELADGGSVCFGATDYRVYIDETWAQYEVDFENVTPGPLGPDWNQLCQIQFYVGDTSQAFNLWVDDVALVP